MKSIQKQEVINYSLVDFQDAITMLSLMDGLQSDAKKNILYKLYDSLSEEEKVLYRREYGGNNWKSKAQYDILSELGFCPTTPLDFDALSIDDLQKK